MKKAVAVAVRANGYHANAMHAQVVKQLENICSLEFGAVVSLKRQESVTT